MTTTPTGTAAPTGTVIAPGPYALLITNANRQGSTYDVLLVDLKATVVARVTAKLPLLKPNQTLTLSPVSAGGSHAYYLDGDTDIHSLAPSGATAVVKTIGGGTTGELAFAVGPGEQRIAVSVISEQSVDTRTTGHGYIENLADGGGHIDVFSNTADDSYRWPIAWYGNDIVDAIGGSGYCQPGGYGPGGVSAIPCAQSIHVIDATTQNRVATICEVGSPLPSGEDDQRSLEGRDSPAGVACYAGQNVYSNGNNTSSCNLLAVSWTGAARPFDTCSANNGSINEGNCFLSPDGSRMACTDNGSQALVLLTPPGVTHSLGRRYTVLGWIDPAHLVVDVDRSTLAVLDVDTGAATNLALTSADEVTMQGVLGGS